MNPPIPSDAAALSCLWRASAGRPPILLTLRSSADPTASDIRDAGYPEQRPTDARTHPRRNRHHRSGARQHHPDQRSKGFTTPSATDLERRSVRR